MAMARTDLRIGEIAARAGVSIDTVRYYEQRKLLPKAARTEGGFRLFAPETIDRVLFIKQAQALGLSLDEIKLLLTNGQKAGECRKVRDLLQVKLAELAERMKAQRKFQQLLSRYLDACERELNRGGAEAQCPVISEITRSPRTDKRR